eukprot:4453525-Pleurochrysis_carterae.AAC.2
MRVVDTCATAGVRIARTASTAARCSSRAAWMHQRGVHTRDNGDDCIVQIHPRKIMLDFTICRSRGDNTRLLVVVDLLQAGSRRQAAHAFNCQCQWGWRAQGAAAAAPIRSVQFSPRQ